MIFGPIFAAALLMLAVFLSPLWSSLNYVNPKVVNNAASSLSPQVLKGQLIKRNALEHGYVPFFGSSEWSRFDPFHPAVLAAKYDRSYQPFLLGARGSQSLTHFFVMQSINPQLKNKKAVVFVSPQWFTPKGEDPNAFHFTIHHYRPPVGLSGKAAQKWIVTPLTDFYRCLQGILIEKLPVHWHESPLV